MCLLSSWGKFRWKKTPNWSPDAGAEPCEACSTLGVQNKSEVRVWKSKKKFQRNGSLVLFLRFLFLLLLLLAACRSRVYYSCIFPNFSRSLIQKKKNDSFAPRFGDWNFDNRDTHQRWGLFCNVLRNTVDDDISSERSITYVKNMEQGMFDDVVNQMSCWLQCHGVGWCIFQQPFQPHDSSRHCIWAHFDSCLFVALL